MAKFLVTMPCYVDGVYHDASGDKPIVIDFDVSKGRKPNSTWKLLTEPEADAALAPPPKAPVPGQAKRGARPNDQTPL